MKTLGPLLIVGFMFLGIAGLFWEPSRESLLAQNDAVWAQQYADYHYEHRHERRHHGFDRTVGK